MAGNARYLWGDSKVDFVSFKIRNSPPKKAGRMYFDSDKHFRFCEDGTRFLLIKDVLHTSSSSSSSSSNSSSSSASNSSSSSSSSSCAGE